MKGFSVALAALVLMFSISVPMADEMAAEDLEKQPLFTEDSAATVVQPDMMGISLRQVVNMFAWLALLILILFGLVWVMRNILPSARLAASSSRIVKVLAKTHLTPKQSIYVIQVGKSMFVVGATPESVTNLGKIEDEEDIALILEQAGAREGESQFRAALSRIEAHGYENTVGRLLNRAKGELDRLVGKVSVLRGADTKED